MQNGQQEEEDETEVWPENADAYQVFLDLDTCWRRTRTPVNGPMGTLTILDYWEGLLPEGVREALHAHGYRGQRYREVWADIKVMERAARAVLNESDKK